MTDSLRDAGDIGVLADEVRRRLYLYVSAQQSPVGRDQAAAALGIARHQAKFQLDRLEETGLLVSDYVRLTGRNGPGAGRPAKVYRRSDREISVSLPEREYALAGMVMADAIARAINDVLPVQEALAQAAGDRGRAIGAEVRSSAVEPLQLAFEALASVGYEPRVEDGRIVLANCPFHALARTQSTVVCRMNEALLSGVCASIGGIAACHEPGTQRCCVVLCSA